LRTGTAALSAFACAAGCVATSSVACIVAAVTSGSASVNRSVGARIGISPTASARGHVRRGVHSAAARFAGLAAFAAAQDAAETSPVPSGVAADVVIQVEFASSAGREGDAESKTNLEHTELHGLERCARHLPSQFPNFHRTGRNFSRVKSCTQATDFPIVGFLTLAPRLGLVCRGS
jgi:hypothetical protein